MQLEGKVVLITGASEGIGAACAKVFHARGAKVAMLARSAEKLKAAAPEGAFPVTADLLEQADRISALERVMQRFGRLDVLVNNAGAGVYLPSYRAPMPAVRNMFELNFFAPLDLIQRASQIMIPQGGGAVVNVSSIAGQVTLPWLTLYSATKHALNSFGDGLRTELAPHNIHVMTVCPGYVRTRFQQNILAGKAPDLGATTRRWAITPERCAADLVKGLERNARTVVTPASGWLLVALHAVFPRIMDWQFEKMYKRDHMEPKP